MQITRNLKSVESANALLNLREKISQNTALVSDEWLDRLIKWANENNLPNVKAEYYPEKTTIQDIKPFHEYHFPRNKDELRNVSGLFFEKWRIIDELPNEFGNLTELELLCFRGLKRFPSCVLKLKKLKWLAFNNRYNEINTNFILPKELVQLSQLRSIYIDYYKLKRFPKVILKFDKLHRLSLIDCSLNSIPRGFEVLAKHIDTIFLDDNLLKNIPTSICKCLKLSWLSLNGCGLITLPNRFVRLQNLQNLELRNNNFVEFPQIIFELKNLKRLHINQELITPEIAEKLKNRKIDIVDYNTVNFID